MSEHDPTDFEAIEREQVLEKRRLKNAQIVEQDDVKWLMSSKRGRRIVWRGLERAGVFRSVFNTNAMQFSFNEGNRNEGLVMLTLINAHAPDQYIEMLKEHANGPASDGRSSQ